LIRISSSFKKVNFLPTLQFPEDTKLRNVKTTDLHILKVFMLSHAIYFWCKSVDTFILLIKKCIYLSSKLCTFNYIFLTVSHASLRIHDDWNVSRKLQRKNRWEKEIQSQVLGPLRQSS
jgi:hypothetical protein